MSNLEDAAALAVAQVRPLLEHLADIQRECTEAMKYVNDLRQRLDADRTALREAVGELAQGAQDAAQHLGGEIPAVEAALNALVKTSAEAAPHARQVQSEAAMVDNLAVDLDAVEPHVTALADAADQAGKSAIQRAAEVEHGLAQAIDAAEQLLSIELAGILADARRGIEKAGENLVSSFHDTCAAELDQSDHDWQAKLAEVLALAEKAFASMEQHTKDVVEYTGTMAQHLADEQLDLLAQEASTLRTAIEEVGHELGEDKARLQTAAEVLYESLKVTTEEAKTAESKLDEVRGRWGIEGFPC